MRIRVAHIITRFDKGGSAENTFLTVIGLDQRRYETSLITGRSDESSMGEMETAATALNLARIKEGGIATYIIPELVRNIHPSHDLQALIKLNRLLRAIKPHLVHTHTSKAGILGRMAARINKVPVVVHTPHGHVFWGYFGPLTSSFFVALERFAARGTDRLVMLTGQEQTDHVQRRIAAPDKFTVIHSGVSLEPFLRIIDNQRHREELGKEMGVPTDAFVVGTVGRLTAVKGHRYLLEGMAQAYGNIPNLFGIFMGDGELRDELKGRAASLGLGKRVIFPGWREDVAKIMSLFDVFVLPSLNEGMGRVLVEAMAAAKPIIASDVGGIRNLVRTGENGMLVPPADSDALAASLIYLHSGPEIGKSMGEAGRKRAAAFSDTVMTEKIDTLYSELIRDKHVQI